MEKPLLINQYYEITILNHITKEPIKKILLIKELYTLRKKLSWVEDSIKHQLYVHGDLYHASNIQKVEKISNSDRVDIVLEYFSVY
jgi:hypothetical protein